MTDQEMNEAIARKCGLKVKDVPIVPAFIDLHHDYLTDKAFRAYRKAYPFGSIPMRVPNYCTDLNAMHEASATITHPSIQGDYVCHLVNIVRDARKPKEEVNRDYFEVAEATARQRAEAFLRTFGLWKE